MERKIKIRFLSLFLSLILCLTSIPVYAYDVDTEGYSIEYVSYQSSDGNNFSVTVSAYAEIASEYVVTIPKVVVLDGNEKKASYYVKVEGDIAGYEMVYVVPDRDVKLYTKNKDMQRGKITQDKQSWRYYEFDQLANGYIDAPTITAGRWCGTFYFNIYLDSYEPEMVLGDIVIPSDLDDDYRLLIEELYKNKLEPDEDTPSEVAGLYDDDGNQVAPYSELASKGFNPSASKGSGSTPLKDIINDYPTGKHLILPDGTESVGSGSIGGAHLDTVILPNGVTKIEDGTFAGTGAKYIGIPKSVKSIGSNAFDNETKAYRGGSKLPSSDKPYQVLAQDLDKVLEKEDVARITLIKGERYLIKALYNFKNNVTNESTIVSSDDSIVTFVPECFLDALEVGEATISGTYTTADGREKDASIIVTVIDPNGSNDNPNNSKSYTLPPVDEWNGQTLDDAVSLKEDEKVKIKIPSDDIDIDDVTFLSNDNEIAYIQNGDVIAVKEGEAVITASVDDKSVSFKVNVDKKSGSDSPDEPTVQIDETLPDNLNDSEKLAFSILESKQLSNPDKVAGLYDADGGLIVSYAKLVEDGFDPSTDAGENNGIVRIISAYPDSKYLVLPEGVETIGEHAFDSAPLTGILLPFTVKTIKDDAFANSQIKYINIPESAEIVSESAFNNTPAKEANAVCYLKEPIDTSVNSEEIVGMAYLYVPDVTEWDGQTDETEFIVTKEDSCNVSELLSGINTDGLIVTSSDENVVVYENGELKTIGTGTAEVTFTATVDSEPKTYTINVKSVNKNNKIIGNGKVTLTRIHDKELIDKLIEQGYLHDESELCAMYEATPSWQVHYPITVTANVTAAYQTPVAVYHYNGTEWEYIGTKNTEIMRRVSASFDSLSPLAYVNMRFFNCKHTTTKSSYVNYIEPTCLKKGSRDKVFTCKTCGKTVSVTNEEINAYGHNFNGTKTVVKTPTCTEEGITRISCTRCKEYNEISVNALGHTRDTATVENRIEPTCTEEGSYESVVCCKTCGVEISRTTVTIPKLGHDFVDGICSRCGEVTDEPGYITFSSPNAFTLKTANGRKWNGTIQYSLDNGETWSTWSGTTTISVPQGKTLCVRGTNNTRLCAEVKTSNNVIKSTEYRWILTGSEISCNGNIETLLDYKKVLNGEHPTMANECFMGLLAENASLIKAPELPATKLSTKCYRSMFYKCTSLVNAPELPATELAEYCYAGMFSGCTSLINAPELPATELFSHCYLSMFQGCTKLTTAPKIFATKLATYCCYCMFAECTSLVKAPELPATELVESCYSSMFSGCTSLIEAPELPATKLKASCYSYMFHKCTSLVNAPELPATELAKTCYSNMFYNCTSLVKAPELPATELAESCYGSMFSICTSLVEAPVLPATILPKNCYSCMFWGCTSLTAIPELICTEVNAGALGSMFNSCTSLKVSTTKTGEYQIAYGIPAVGTATKIGTDTIGSNTFTNTGGTYKKNAHVYVNKVYYLSTQNSIVPANN